MGFWEMMNYANKLAPTAIIIVLILIFARLGDIGDSIIQAISNKKNNHNDTKTSDK